MSLVQPSPFGLFEYNVTFNGPAGPPRAGRFSRNATLTPTDGSNPKTLIERDSGQVSCLTFSPGQFNPDGTEDRFMIIHDIIQYRFRQKWDGDSVQYVPTTLSVFSAAPDSGAKGPLTRRYLTDHSVVHDRVVGENVAEPPWTVTFGPIDRGKESLTSRKFVSAASNVTNSDIPPGDAPLGYAVDKRDQATLTLYASLSFASGSHNHNTLTRFALIPVKAID